MPLERMVIGRIPLITLSKRNIEDIWEQTKLLMESRLPYLIKGIIDALDRILNKKDIGVTFSPPYLVGRMLDSSKHPMDPTKLKGVYSIPCSCGKTYIGKHGYCFKLVSRNIVHT